MKWKTLLAMAACLPALPAAGGEVQGDSGSERFVSVDEVGRSFSQRSVEIISLAQRGDVSGLTTLVAPSARFTVWEGDVGIGRKDGPEGAIEFAQRTRPTAYGYATAFAGPLSTDICGSQTVTVWLKQADGQRAYVTVFKYNKGVLIEAIATMANVSEGKIEPVGEH